MAHDEASAGLLHELTDTHLADRARLGDAVAFDELVRRHGKTAVAFATVVTADTPVARGVAIRAFTDVLDQIESGGYSIDDPFVPGLLRSTRELGKAEAVSLAEANEEMDSFVPELARSTRWLTAVQGLDEMDTALALDVEDDAVPGLIAWTEELLGNRIEAVDEVLSSIHVTVPISFAADARSTWRTWISTMGTVPMPREKKDRAALLPRIEPVATKVLRGAAVVLLVAGAAGLLVNNSGSASGSKDASADRAAASSTGHHSDRASAREIESKGSTGRTGRKNEKGSTSSSSKVGSASTDRTAAGGSKAHGGSSGSGGTHASSTGGGSGSGSVGGSSGSAGGSTGGGVTAPSPGSTPSPSPTPPAPAPKPQPSPSPSPSPSPTPTTQPPTTTTQPSSPIPTLPPIITVPTVTSPFSGLPGLP